MEGSKVEVKCTHCGQTFKIDSGHLGRKANCTRCGGVFALQLQAAPATPGDAGLCSICQSPIEPTDTTLACSDCKALYHSDCWQYNKGCAVYGCSQVSPTEHRDNLEIPASYWGKEEKNCPNCNQVILAAAVRCRFCGATFESAAPVDRGQFHQASAIRQNLPAVRRGSIWLLILSVLTCTAPFAAVFGSMWYYGRRKEIAASPPLQSAMCKIALGLAIGQSALVVLLAAIYGLFYSH